MQRIGVLYNPQSEQSMALSGELAEWLQARGKDVWRGSSHEGRDDPEALNCMDLLVALGGDGTVLRAIRLAVNCGAPVLPVALGHLNFMAELEPQELYDGLETLFEGKGWNDERAFLEAKIISEGHVTHHLQALNEIVVARGEINRVLEIGVEIYHATLTTYHADGVIVATATGSTAYALAAGGPIIDPRSGALVLVPIAAHLTTIPSLVLHEDAEVSLIVSSRYPAGLSADGLEAIPLRSGDRVEVRRSASKATFARVHPPSTFYERIARRLQRST